MPARSGVVNAITPSLTGGCAHGYTAGIVSKTNQQKGALAPGACFAAGVIAFLAVGLIEYALLAGSERAASAGGSLPLFLLGLDGLVGVVAGLGLALTLPPVFAIARPGHWLKTRVLAPADTAPEALRSEAAWGLAGLGALAPLAVAAFVGGHVAHGFNQQGLAGPFTALAALAGAAAALVALFPLKAAAQWILDRVAPSGRVAGLPAPAIPLVLVVLAGALAALRVGRIDLESYKMGGYAALAGGALLALVLAFVLARLPRLPVTLAGATLAAVSLALCYHTVYAFGDAAAESRLIPQDGHLSRVTVGVLRRALDRDGDGYSALLAGGDCDDADPNVGPHAREIPGNGIDDNCQGGDAPLEDVADAADDPAVDEPQVAAPGEPVAGKPVVGEPAAEAPPPPPRHNVLLILIDTLRPDHLGLHGYSRPTSPNIDAWAKDAVVFDHAWAHAPNTPRSMPSIITGRYPSRIKWKKRFDNYSGIEPENETVFEIFQQAGWRTEAVSAHWYFERAQGFKDGVDHWDNRGFLTIKESNTQSAAPDITPRVVARLGELSKAEQPFLLFAHYFDPHGKYLNQPTAKVFGSSLKDKYDSEISFTDMHLKPVFEALEAHGLHENTVVVLTSDHGEAFKEHGFHFHGRTVYSEELRVPLIVRVPGVAGKRVDLPVGLVDLTPTLADLVGLKAPKAQGKSLVPLLTGAGEPPRDRVIFLEQLPYPGYQTHVVGAIDVATHLKVVRDITNNVTEVFDLNTDRPEKRNLLDKDPDAGKALLERLTQFIDGDPGQ